MGDGDQEKGFLGKILPLVLAALLGGSGSIGIREFVLPVPEPVPPRPDPFTGRDGIDLEKRLRRDMERAEHRLDRLEELMTQVNLAVSRMPDDDLLKIVTKNSVEIGALREVINPRIRSHTSPMDLIPPGRLR